MIIDSKVYSDTLKTSFKYAYKKENSLSIFCFDEVVKKLSFFRLFTKMLRFYFKTYFLTCSILKVISLFKHLH